MQLLQKATKTNTEAEYGEALAIRRKLAVAHPEAYEPDVAMTRFNLALVFEKTGRHEEALAAARESLETYGRCAERNPAQFGGDLEDAKALVKRLERNET